MNESLYPIYALIFISVMALTWLFVNSSVKGFGRYRKSFTSTANTRLSSMFLFIDTQKIFLGYVLAIVVVPVAIYLWSSNPVYAVVAGIVTVIFPRLSYAWMARRRLRDFEAALPDAISQIAGSMRAGATLPIAIEAMVRETKGPISQEFSLVLRENRVGVTLEEAFENLGDRVPCPDLDLVIAAALIARDVGGNLSEIFDRLATTLREKAAMEGKIKALTSQGKLQGWVVGMLPVGMILVLFQMEPEAMQPLVSSVMGWGFMGVMGILELFGMLMIRKIVSIDV